MAKPRCKWNPSTFHNRLNEGRGQGKGKDYSPFIHIHDIPSLGICTRVTSETVHRVHHLLSRNELAFFYILDFDENIIDIREQFPLLCWDDPHDLNPIVSLAERHGIKYPRDPKSKYPFVQTTDFLVTTKDGSLHAYSIKESKEFLKPRVRELQEFERIYWKEKGIPWTIVTEIDLDDFRSYNIQWIYHARDIGAIFTDWKLLEAVMSFEQELYLTTPLPIVRIAEEARQKFGLSDGLGLTAFQRLLFEHRLILDLTDRIDLYAHRPSPCNRQETYPWLERYQ